MVLCSLIGLPLEAGCLLKFIHRERETEKKAAEAGTACLLEFNIKRGFSSQTSPEHPLRRERQTQNNTRITY